MAALATTDFAIDFSMGDVLLTKLLRIRCDLCHLHDDVRIVGVQ